tara:strand:- start:948 stop:1235 length:288 start_codon:yes stop_codon:yes gene_type:complete
MPPKTAKLKKKTGNNKTKKKDRKQFKVDGKTFKLKDNSSKVRIELSDAGNVIKFKPDLWPEEANRLWDELQSKGLIKYGVMKTKTIDKKKNKKED